MDSVGTAAAAEGYKVNSTPQKKHALQFLDRLHLKENSKVLDIGCGTGYLTSILAERVGPRGKVVGVDPDKERIKVAQETFGNHNNITFYEGSAEEFPKDQYDLITSTHVLHWIKDKETVFRKVYNNLKPGGKFAFIIIPDVRGPPYLFQLSDLMGPERSSQLKGRFHIEPVEVYEMIATRVGFTVDFKTNEPSGDVLANFDAVIDWHFASTHGGFDPATIDQTTLKDYAKSFGDGPVDVSYQVATIILTK